MDFAVGDAALREAPVRLCPPGSPCPPGQAGATNVERAVEGLPLSKAKS
jgi:hypothetical protein